MSSFAPARAITEQYSHPFAKKVKRGVKLPGER
jgi:hypothetical protein